MRQQVEGLTALHNLEAEMSVLGAAMLKESAQKWLAANVQPRAFFFPAHRIIASTIIALHEENTPAEILTTKNRLLEARQLNEIGGEDYLVQVAESVPSAANVDHYGKIVLEYAGRREMIRRLDLARSAVTDERSFSKVLSGLSKISSGLKDPGRAAGPSLSNLITFNGTFEPVSVDYLIEPYFPKSKTILVDADGGTGKSSWLLSVAADLSNGRSRFGRFHGEKPVKTLFLFRDADRAEEYETVYRANEGKPGWITYHCEPRMLTADYADEIIETVQRGEFGLVVFDPFFYFLQGVMQNTNDALQALPACQEVNRIASTTGAVCAVVRHTSKGDVNKAASELGMGTVQFRNSFRGQLVMRWHPQSQESPDYKGVVVVTDEKGSILVPRGDVFSFRRIELQIQYISSPSNPFTKTDRKQERGRPPEALEECVDWLRGLLKSGPKRLHEIRGMAEERKIAAATLYRAKDALEAQDGKDGAYKTWSIAYDPFADDAEPTYDHVYRGGD